MRRVMIFLAALALLLLVPGTAAAAPNRADDASVSLRPNAGSGVRATIQIDGLKVRGTATGLKPGTRYITLYYGNLSTDQPGQPNTCADPRTAAGVPLPEPARDWATDPEWRVRKNGMGTLRATADRTVVDTTGGSRTYTVSIRSVPATAGPDPYLGFNPVTYPVVACGKVRLSR